MSRRRNKPADLIALMIIINHKESDICDAFTSINSKAAVRSLMNLRINARNFFSFGCLLRNSIIQYLRLVLKSLFATLVCMLTMDAIPSSCPAVNGGASPLMNAFTCTSIIKMLSMNNSSKFSSPCPFFQQFKTYSK